MNTPCFPQVQGTTKHSSLRMRVPILGCFHLKQARMGCIRHQGAAPLSEALWFVSKVWPPRLPIHRIPADLALSVGKGPGSDNLQNSLPSPRIMRRFEKPFSHNSISQFSSPVGLRGIAFISPLRGGRGVAYRDPRAPSDAICVVGHLQGGLAAG